MKQTHVKAWLLSGVLFTLGACAGNAAPYIHDVEPQTAYVGSRLEFHVYASDDDGDELTFGFSCPTLQLQDQARLLPVGSSVIFSWMPMATDVGQHQIDFSVSDGSESDVSSVALTVKPSTDSKSAPIFRKPLGEGLTLDLSKEKCLKLEVLVEDVDSVNVDISQNPVLQGSTLTATGTHSATFNWCPTPAQAATSTHMLNLIADDKDNPPVQKNVTILIRTDLPPTCPGAAPVISHVAPAAQTTSDSIQVTAMISDDKGLKGTPVIYHATTKPVDPTNIDFSTMSQLTMTPGSPNSYSALLPNPTAGLAAGASKSIYYVIVAEDDDDSSGNCDHRTQAPAGSTYEVLVTKPQGGTTCTSDVQCTTGQLCKGGNCVADTCTPKDTNSDQLYWEQSDCPPNYFCPVKGPTTSPSHCVYNCLSDSSCKLPGAVCKAFDTKRGCGTPGSKAVGAACSDFTECASRAMCMPWQGGYCSISDCNSGGIFTGKCPAGSACIPIPDIRFQMMKHWVCLKTCIGNSDCRSAEGYTCQSLLDDKSNPVKACK